MERGVFLERQNWIKEDKTVNALNSYRKKSSRIVILTLFLVFAGINTIHARTEKVSRVTFYVL